MQNIWYRVKRLSPYVELKEKVDYNKELATNDVEEIISLLKKPNSFGLKKVIYQLKDLQMLHQLYGLYLIILINFIHPQNFLPVT